MADLFLRSGFDKGKVVIEFGTVVGHCILKAVCLEVEYWYP